MTDQVRRCEDHGYFSGPACPVCAREGRQILSGDRRARLSKFMSGALRHFPADAGIELDSAGWTDFDDFVAAVDEKYVWATRDDVVAVIRTDPEGRFERHGDRVRAAYGHSVDVDLEAIETPVPDVLYHGTAPESLDPIREEGLEPMSRQLVHLSDSVEGARDVGKRHADDPVVLSVDVPTLEAAGHRVVKRGRTTYTTDSVPPDCLDIVDG